MRIRSWVLLLRILCSLKETFSKAVIGESLPGSAQFFLREPVDQTARQGTHVTLPCRVAHKKGTLQWTRNGFGLGVERNLTGFDRYHMTGSDEEGDFTLDIDPVMLEDDAKFQCQVGAARGVAPIRSSFAFLTVTVPPQEPEIINGKELRTTEGRKVIIKCVSKGGKPAAEITWVDGKGAVVSEGVTYETEPVENTKRVTAKSKLEFIAEKIHHNSTFTCEAQNSADPVPKKASIKIFVEYAPDVKISMMSPAKNVREFEDVKYKCEAHANPTRMNYRWFVEDELVPGNQGQELTLKNVKRSQNGQIIKCEVSNEVGKSEETEILDINYSPRFTIKPSDVSGERDQEAVLDCEVDGNPSPTYTWFRNGDLQTVIGYDRNLSVVISPSTVGKYICRASVTGFSEITESADVLMKGPPRVIRRNPVQFGTEGDTVHLTCEAFSIPPPITLQWSLYGYPIDAISPHYSLLETGKKDGLKSTLVIRSSISSDYGDYNCTVRNQYGSDSFVITLERKKSLPLIIILSAVIGGIVLTVATILIMIICRRSSFKSKLSSDGKIRGGARSSTTNSSSKRNGTESEALNPHKSFSSDNELDDWDVGRESIPPSDSSRYLPLQGYEDYHHPPAAHSRHPSRMEMGFPHPHIPSANSIVDSGYIGQPFPHHYGSYNLPPVAHSTTALGELNSYRSGLNVLDPRFSAKYGNPYLRSTPSNSSQGLHNPYGHPIIVNAGGHTPAMGSSGKGYSTLTTDRVRKRAAEERQKNGGSNSTGGTLNKKPASFAGSGRVIPIDTGGPVSPGSNRPSTQYIVSPENESKQNSLATHV